MVWSVCLDANINSQLILGVNQLKSVEVYWLEWIVLSFTSEQLRWFLLRHLRAEFVSWSLLQRDAAVWVTTNTRLQLVGQNFFGCNSCERMGQLLYYVSASLVWSQRTLTLAALFSSCGCKRLVPVTTTWTASSQPPESLAVQLYPSYVVAVVESTAGMTKEP